MSDRRHNLIADNDAGTGKKFWTIERVKSATGATSVRTTWGAVGTTGQTRTKPFGSTFAANSYIEKKLNEKFGKGYDYADGQIPLAPVKNSKVKAALADLDGLLDDI
jgi:predicted DNA-binding WGR domain protein